MGGKSTKANNAKSQINLSLFDSRLTIISTSPRRTRSPEQLVRDEEIKVKKRIRKVLKICYDWDSLDSDEIIEIFTELLVKDKNQIIAAWKTWRFKSNKDVIDPNLVLWNPSLYEDDVNLTYANFFPCVINQINGNPIVGFNQSSKVWFGLPKLDFLPLDVNDIIAGDGGLLCINGGLQPRKINPQTPPIPYAEDYNFALYPAQSILLVCNPLTKEVKYIPRHCNKTLNNKIAWMTTMVHPQKQKHNEPPQQKHRYRLYVIGSHSEVPTLYKKGSDELVLMVYDSRSNIWILGSVVGQCRFPGSGKTCIAIFNEGYMIGGQEKSNDFKIDVKRHKRKNEIVKIDVEKQKKPNDEDKVGIENQKKSNNDVEDHTKKLIKDNYKSDDTMSNFLTDEEIIDSTSCTKSNHMWINKIFFIQGSTLKWHTLDFDILDLEGFPRENLQAPRLLQCTAGSSIYVITRSIVDPVTIEIYEVVMYNGFPSGDFLLETMMPKEIYIALFNNKKSLKPYDCCAGLQILCFLAPDDINNAVTVAIYDVTSKRWSTSLTPTFNNQGKFFSYALTKCGWNPNWFAKP